MSRILTRSQIERFWRDGCVFPVRIMPKDQAIEIRSRLEAFEKSTGGPLDDELRHKTHLLFTWLNELVRDTRIVDAIEDLYGPDLLCWTTEFFIKEAHNAASVSWHQDSTYWGLSRPDVVTAWLALTPSNRANGAMSFIPGTQNADQVPHRGFAKDGLPTRVREFAGDADDSAAITVELEPGEISLHHVRVVHGSPSNPSNDRRIGFAIRYLPTSVEQIAGNDSATLVRGTDRFHHFELEPRPTSDMDPAFVKLHEAATRPDANILSRGGLASMAGGSMALYASAA